MSKKNLKILLNKIFNKNITKLNILPDKLLDKTKSVLDLPLIKTRM